MYVEYVLDARLVGFVKHGSDGPELNAVGKRRSDEFQDGLPARYSSDID